MCNQLVTHMSATPRLERTCHAIGDPTRRSLLELLRGGERSAGELAAAFTISRPAVSKHLRVLREACLVTERRDGRRRLYALDPRPLEEVDGWLARYRTFWAARLVELKELVESEADPDPDDPTNGDDR